MTLNHLNRYKFKLINILDNLSIAYVPLWIYYVFIMYLYKYLDNILEAWGIVKFKSY
jgi:hypothetical protein